jgi:hypothetical protein
MAATTYGAALPTRRAAKRKGLFARFYQALQEARMREARREIARYRHLMPDELERAAYRLDCRSEDSLPFVR